MVLAPPAFPIFIHNRQETVNPLLLGVVVNGYVLDSQGLAVLAEYRILEGFLPRELPVEAVGRVVQEDPVYTELHALVVVAQKIAGSPHPPFVVSAPEDEGKRVALLRAVARCQVQDRASRILREEPLPPVRGIEEYRP